MTTTLMRLWRSVIYLIERTEQVAYYLPRSLLRSWPFAGVNARIARRWGWVTRKVWAMTGNAHTLEKSAPSSTDASLHHLAS
jgi:hypothetical protein